MDLIGNHINPYYTYIYLGAFLLFLCFPWVLALGTIEFLMETMIVYLCFSLFPLLRNSVVVRVAAETITFLVFLTYFQGNFQR